MQNAQFRTRIICGISDAEKTFWIQYTLQCDWSCSLLFTE